MLVNIFCGGSLYNENRYNYNDSLEGKVYVKNYRINPKSELIINDVPPFAVVYTQIGSWATGIFTKAGSAISKQCDINSVGLTVTCPTTTQIKIVSNNDNYIDVVILKYG